MTDRKRQRAERNASLFGFNKGKPEAPTPSAQDKRLAHELNQWRNRNGKP